MLMTSVAFVLAVFTIREWVNIITSARKHNLHRVEVLDFSLFYDLKDIFRADFDQKEFDVLMQVQKSRQCNLSN